MKIKSPATQKDLDKISCEDSSCDHEHDEDIVLKPRCCQKGIQITYQKASGTLDCECFECGKDIGQILVARK